MNNFILDIRNVTYSINSAMYIDNITFSLKEGEHLVIFGPENSGATKLFDLIIQANPKYEGDIFYKGKSTKTLDYSEQLMHKRDIGYVHGDYGLLSNMTVEQNISLPLEYHSDLSASKIKENVESIISELNLVHCKKLRPIDLTGSEILKTAFARAIVMDPDLLYIEHAFKSQCPLNIKPVTDFIFKRFERHDKALILITYYPLDFIDISDSFIMFFNGKIVFSGGREDFLNSDNPYLLQYKNNSIKGPMVIL
ncbi:MAG: ATP-binding cassette domain-containing protein [Leptospirales bacterium]|nr:ATP-binding cassette domain-containing protein [Leptospirales bacterium]